MQTADLLFDCLHRMDAEATTFRDGLPTGLNWFGAHIHPKQKRPQTEPCWSRQLMKMMTEAGLPTEREVQYPRTRSGRLERCDLKITSPTDGRLWIEVKGAWREYWRKRNKEGIYRSYLLHPLVKGLDPKSHTVPLDLKKLERLRKSEADRIAILLIGFDSHVAPMDGDVAELAQKAGLDASPWRVASTRWDDSRRDGCRVRCWYWWRDVD